MYSVCEYVYDTPDYCTWFCHLSMTLCHTSHDKQTHSLNSFHKLCSPSDFSLSSCFFWFVYGYVFVVKSHNREKRRSCTKKSNKSILNCTTKKNWLQKICIWKDIDFDNKVRKWTNGSENNEDGAKLRGNV